MKKKAIFIIVGAIFFLLVIVITNRLMKVNEEKAVFQAFLKDGFTEGNFLTVIHKYFDGAEYVHSVDVNSDIR